MISPHPEMSLNRLAHNASRFVSLPDETLSVNVERAGVLADPHRAAGRGYAYAAVYQAALPRDLPKDETGFPRGGWYNPAQD